MKKLLCLFLNLLIFFQVFAFEVFETEKNKSYLFEDYKHLVKEFDDFCYYADLPISSEDVFFSDIIKNENTQKLNMSKDYIVYQFFDEFEFIVTPARNKNADVILILMQRIDGEVYITTTVYKLTAIVEERIWIFE